MHKEIVNKEAFEQLAAEAGLTDEPSHLSEQAVRTPTTMELETEEIYQRARPLPMVRHWLTRCVVVAVASLATPFVADLLHPAGESPPAEATDVRHAEGTSHESSRVVDMQWSLLLLLVLIGLALVLERLREVLEELPLIGEDRVVLLPEAVVAEQLLAQEHRRPRHRPVQLGLGLGS